MAIHGNFPEGNAETGSRTEGAVNQNIRAGTRP